MQQAEVPSPRGARDLGAARFVMDGLTPWELSTLKVLYHRCDRGSKGFLNADDVKAMCAGLGVRLTDERAQALFDEMDVDHDGRVSFSELMSHLAADEGNVHDMQLRAAMLDRAALAATGAALPLLLKGKAMIVLGTLFYDPVRLFRGFYVDLVHPLRSLRAAGADVAHRDLSGVVEGIRRGMRAGKALRSTALVVGAVLVDCFVGALVFLLYTKVRAVLQRWAQRRVAAASASPPSPGVAPQRRRLRMPEVCALEAAAGATAGAFAGVAAPLARRFVARELFTQPQPHFLLRGFQRVRREAAAHAAFFTGFFFFRHVITDVTYHSLGFKSNTVTDAVVTTLAGCAAGGAWKCVAEPLRNRDEFVVQNGARAWWTLPWRRKLGIRCAGLRSSLLQTMPITGVAFLVYEASFLFLV